MPGRSLNNQSRTSTAAEPDFRNCGTPTVPQLGQYSLSSSDANGGGTGDLMALEIPTMASITTATNVMEAIQLCTCILLNAQNRHECVSVIGRKSQNNAVFVTPGIFNAKKTLCVLEVKVALLKIHNCHAVSVSIGHDSKTAVIQRFDLSLHNRGGQNLRRSSHYGQYRNLGGVILPFLE